MSKAQKAKENLQKAQVKKNASFDIIRNRAMQQDAMIEAHARDNDPYGQIKPFSAPSWGSHVTDQQIENLTGVPQRPFYRWFQDPIGVFSQYAFWWIFSAVFTLLMLFRELLTGP